MPYLLDTHTYLWFIEGNKELPKSALSKLVEIDSPCFISIVSFSEIAIKLQLKKLHLELDFEELFSFAERNQKEIIQINQIHLSKILELGNFHNDPFDRIIIAQAISENLTIISKDSKIKNYPVKLSWD